MGWEGGGSPARPRRLDEPRSTCEQAWLLPRVASCYGEAAGIARGSRHDAGLGGSQGEAALWWWLGWATCMGLSIGGSV